MEKMDIFLDGLIDGNMKQISNLEKGGLCLANDGGNWYRVQYEGATVNSTEHHVIYVDYNRRGTVRKDQLRKIPVELLQFSRRCVQIKLEKNMRHAKNPIVVKKVVAGKIKYVKICGFDGKTAVAMLV
jgi:hypothetical protein